MFDERQLEHVIGLQDRAYRFLLWASRMPADARPKCHASHRATSTAQVIADWLVAHTSVVPPDLRTAPGDVGPFALLVAALLQTSFAATSSTERCEFCSACEDRLALRRPNDNDRAAAHALKMVAISTLADELELPLLRNEVDALINAPDSPAEDIAWLTYAQELLRRSEFASQGTGVLHLWREIAWEDPFAKGQVRIKDTFALTATRVLAAKARVVEYVRAAAKLEARRPGSILAKARFSNAELNVRAKVLEKEIRAAFAGVSRQGGVSWNGAEARDEYRTPGEIDKANRSDTDTRWEQLLDRGDWCPEPGVGGFIFLDPLGRRYYLPAGLCWGLRHPQEPDAMLCCLRAGEFAPLNEAQLACCVRYIELACDRAVYTERDQQPVASCNWQPLLHYWSGQLNKQRRASARAWGDPR
ncbi:MAG: hypothetical protein QM783_03975 [Phycisphaerales bacterium]